MTRLFSDELSGLGLYFFALVGDAVDIGEIPASLASAPTTARADSLLPLSEASAHAPNAPGKSITGAFCQVN
jgi:hypothetical protein